jgi:hypothetical protein
MSLAASAWQYSAALATRSELDRMPIIFAGRVRSYLDLGGLPVVPPMLVPMDLVVEIPDK